MANQDYRYFLFSMDYVNDKNAIYDKVNKVFVLGTVNYNGTKREFSSLSKVQTLGKYTDVRVVAQGDITKMQYTMPRTKPKRSNEE